MGLDFTNIHDKEGAALYLLTDGTGPGERALERLAQEIDDAITADIQIVVLDPRRGDGARVKSFYSIQYLPCVLIVRDDDTIAFQWDHQLPRAEDVAFQVSHISGGMRHS